MRAGCANALAICAGRLMAGSARLTGRFMGRLSTYCPELIVFVIVDRIFTMNVLRQNHPSKLRNDNKEMIMGR